MTNEQLVKEYQNGNLTVLNELIENNIGLVKYFANKYSGVAEKTTLEVDDLEQEGWMAFLDAVKKYEFNAEEPTLFSTYASMRIKYKILNALNTSICRTRKRDVSSEEIATCSLSDIVPGTDDMTLEQTLPDEQSEEPFMMVEAEIDNAILRKDLFYVIETVLGKGVGLVRNVLIMHYGLKGKERTFEQIGNIFKVTGSRVQQAENEAIRNIRKSTAGKELMRKYKWIIINSLESEIEKINQLDSPENIINRMDSLDNLLIGILEQCC